VLVIGARSLVRGLWRTFCPSGIVAPATIPAPVGGQQPGRDRTEARQEMLAVRPPPAPRRHVDLDTMDKSDARDWCRVALRPTVPAG